MKVPTMPISLMSNIYSRIFPAVHAELTGWKNQAKSIPDEELRKQALESMEHKTFHCEGGAIIALTAQKEYLYALKFIVAYQTISDYLDNLCDRSTSLDPDDFAALHEAMEDAINLGNDTAKKNYYRMRAEQNDGGYLMSLVLTCREILGKMPNYELIQPYLLELCQYYCDLQIHKHVEETERVPRLQNWFLHHQKKLPEMEWYEFSACSGSTLGIFCLVSYALRGDFEKHHAENIWKSYFPYIQGLHILLDYFIDQEEDQQEGDLNFCFYYESEEQLFQRLKHFVLEADKSVTELPHSRFHRLINRGLLGVYLSDDKVYEHTKIKNLAKDVIKAGGFTSYFFYLNGRAYRMLQRWFPPQAIKN